MIRGENVVCGTSTTGTGTLTLAACPSSVGAIDPVVAFGTSGAFPFAYTVIEYTDSTFAKPSQFETGVGVLTLAATIGATTLTRAPITTGVIGTPAYTGGSSTPTAITIGTAANVLVFTGPNAHGVLESLHFVVSSMSGSDGLGVSPVCGGSVSNLALAVSTATSGTVYYQRVWLASSGLIKSATTLVMTALTAGAASTVAQALYDIGSNGLPGKRLINFGTSSAGALATTGAKTQTAGAAMFIPAGFYIHAVLPIGGAGMTGSLGMQGSLSVGPSPFGSSIANSGCLAIASVATQTVLNDPATTTSITGVPSPYDIALIYRST